MPKYCSENERVKRDYAFYLEAANGKQSATIDAGLSAIERFEASTRLKPFRKFHVEQARSFRAGLSEASGVNGKPLSAATITSTLKHLRNFFLWLSREPGYRSSLNPNDANYFTPSEQDVRIATARREKHVATLEDIKRVIALMPAETAIERRNQALIAFTIPTGVRDGALASFRLKHVDMNTQTVFQDAREVRTKARKTFTSNFFPVGPEPREIVADHLAMLKNDLGFSGDDPLFRQRSSLRARIAVSLPKDYLDRLGPGQNLSDRFSEAHSQRRPCLMPTHTAFVTRSLALASVFAALQKNGRFGAKILAMKARRPHLSVMVLFPHTSTRKSCWRSVGPVLRRYQPGWISRH